jgi:hypothetical protein
VNLPKFLPLIVLFLAACAGKKNESVTDSTSVTLNVDTTSSPEPEVEENYHGRFTPNMIRINIDSTAEELLPALETRLIELLREPLDSSTQINQQNVFPATIMPYENNAGCISGYIAIVEEVRSSECCPDHHSFHIYLITGTGFQFEMPEDPLVVQGSAEDADVTVDISLDQPAGEDCSYLVVDTNTSLPTVGIKDQKKRTRYTWSRTDLEFDAVTER